MVPDEKVSFPLLPLVPPFADRIVMVPLEDAVPVPLAIAMSPPVDTVAVPAVRVMSAGAEPLEVVPPEIVMDPAVLFASPEEIEIEPLVPEDEAEDAEPVCNVKVPETAVVLASVSPVPTVSAPVLPVEREAESAVVNSRVPLTPDSP